MNYSSNAQIHKEAISSSNKLQESLLEAVEILHNGFIANEQISKVIECNIIDDSKKAQGIYTVDYMNSKFEVNCYIEETYNVGDIVFVLIPDGDFAKTKMILGSSDGSGQGIDWVTQEELNAAVVTLQRNFQAGVEAIGAACTRKGSPPASSSLEDTITAIDAIQTGGNYDTLDVSFGPVGTIYNADDYPNIDAWNIVRIVPPEAPFTVRFFADDHQTILKTDANVPYGGSATCTELDGTILNGLYFKGWNPSPINVRENMDCYPLRGDYVIDANEIQDSWETICVDCGAHYPLGSYKSLVLNGMTIPSVTVPITFYHNVGYQYTYPARTCTAAFHMVKVAEGEDGSTSTWVSSAGFTCDGSSDTWADWTWYGNTAAHWSGSGIRAWLNAAVIQILPQILQDTIKPVTKVSQIYNSTWMDQETIDRIWVPSMKEFDSLASTYRNDSMYTTRREQRGIDYSLVYIPNLNVIFTRTEAGRESQPIGGLKKSQQILGRWPFYSQNTYSNDTGYQIGFCL